MTILHADIESYSECDLKSAGVYRYAEHPSTEILIFSYRFDDGPVNAWVPYDLPPEIEQPLRAKLAARGGILYLCKDQPPQEVVDHINARHEFRAHSAQFERVVLSGVAGKKVNFPHIRIEQTHCTAAKMAAHGMPRGLDDAAKALGTARKAEGGRMEMLQISKPKRPTKKDPATRYTPQNAPEKFLACFLYNVDDVLAECGVDYAVPDLTPSELRVYHFDQLINERGIRIDLKAIGDVRALIEEYKQFLERQCEKLTADPLTDEGLKPTQREKIADWIRANGWPTLMDMQAETVKALVKRDDVPGIVKQVLRIYSTYNAKAVTKYEAMIEAVCADGRLHGMFLYHGANTGRWSSLIVQLQNLFRPMIDDPETAIEAFSTRNLDWIRALYDVEPMKVFASCVRSVLISGDGKDLLFPDYAGIESRGTAWLFDEEWKLDVFRKFDRGEGPDNYKAAYSSMFKVAIELVTKAMRQIGKVTELFFGYEGGAGAFVTGAETYGIDLKALAETVLPTIPDDIRAEAENMWAEMPQHRAGLEHDVFIACDSLKRMWRRAHPKIRQGWRDMKAAAEQAVEHPGTAFSIPNGKIAFKVAEYRGRSWLYMRLPSGRRLAYYNPRWIPEQEVPAKDEWGNDYTQVIPGEMRYWGIDTYTRRWMELTTYGGKLTENAVQGLSACVLRAGLFALERADYPVIGSVHDEPITEPEEGHGSLEHAGALLCSEDVKRRAGVVGMPLAIDGHRGKRYRK